MWGVFKNISVSVGKLQKERREKRGQKEYLKQYS